MYTAVVILRISQFAWTGPDIMVYGLRFLLQMRQINVQYNVFFSGENGKISHKIDKNDSMEIYSEIREREN